MANLMDSKTLRPLASAGKPGAAPNYHVGLAGSIVLVSAVIFGVMAFTAHSVTLFSFDLPVTQALQQFNPPWFDLPMRAINWTGYGVQAVTLVSAVVIVLFLVGWRWAAVVCALDAAGIWGLNILIGIVVNRPLAPPAEISQVVMHLTLPSFPSGHVTSFIGIYGFVWFLVYTRARQQWRRIPLLVILGAMVLLIGPSRSYVGSHWPSDVLASLFLGTIWLILTLYVYQWGKERFFTPRAQARDARGA